MSGNAMNFDYPPALTAHLATLDEFIASTITPLLDQEDNIRFFDHRREHSRTDWDRGGLPRKEWDELLDHVRQLAFKTPFYTLALSDHPQKNLWMCATRFHLSSVYTGGLHLANDLQTEHSIVGNFPDLLMIQTFGSQEQKDLLVEKRLRGEVRLTFGLTEPAHGSDATWMDTSATWIESEQKWKINGTKMWQTGADRATHLIVFARSHGKAGDAYGITAFIIPREASGVDVVSFEWTFNMPTDHATLRFNSVLVPRSAVLGTPGHGLAIAQTFVHENRIRQAASSCGAAAYCVKESVKWANERKVFGKPLSQNQGIQFPLVELATQVEMLRLLVLKTAWEMDRVIKDGGGVKGIEKDLGGSIAMCNYWANRLVCDAADRAIQVHGGIGYSRHKPFEHIYRHHRRYRITEGSEEIQMRKVAGFLFGYIGSTKEGRIEDEENGKKERMESKDKAKL